jgi:hypothetical protein
LVKGPGVTPGANEDEVVDESGEGSNAGGDSGLSGAEIAGIVIGSVIAVTLTIIGIVVWRRKTAPEMEHF